MHLQGQHYGIAGKAAACNSGIPVGIDSSPSCSDNGLRKEEQDSPRVWPPATHVETLEKLLGSGFSLSQPWPLRPSGE